MITSNEEAARELVAAFREIESASPPKMKKHWKGLSVGDKFKHKRKTYVKMSPSTAVDVKMFEKFKNTGLEGPLYEVVKFAR